MQAAPFVCQSMPARGGGRAIGACVVVVLVLDVVLDVAPVTCVSCAEVSAMVARGGTVNSAAAGGRSWQVAMRMEEETVEWLRAEVQADSAALMSVREARLPLLEL